MTNQQYVEVKQCPKCGDTKPLEDFHKDRTKSGGRKSACKKCENFDRQGRGYGKGVTT